MLTWIATRLGVSVGQLLAGAISTAVAIGGLWWFVDSAFTWRAERDAAQVETRKAVQRNADLVIAHAHEIADFKLQQVAEVRVLTTDAAVLPAIATLTEKVRHAPDAASPVSAELDDALDRVLRFTSPGAGGGPPSAGADSVSPDGVRLRSAADAAAARPIGRRRRGEVDAFCVTLAGWAERAWSRFTELQELEQRRATAPPD